MLKTTPELLTELGEAIRARRLAMNWSQSEAARRAGIGVRTLRRMEAGGQATIENLINIAIALRCENTFADLFPLPVARNMDELLKQQREAALPKRPQRARKAKRRAN
ncbi:MAG: helix-turn-helix domain-containing protein [Hyphomonadaceae bacterium]